jgi:hypothetical protein
VTTATKPKPKSQKTTKLPPTPADISKLPPEPTDEFIAPSVVLGQIVLWHAVGREVEYPGIVTRVNCGDGSGTITVSVFVPQLHVLDTRSVVVYHEDDPCIHEDNRKRDGVWRLSDTDRELRKLVPSLEARLRQAV